MLQFFAEELYLTRSRSTATKQVIGRVMLAGRLVFESSFLKANAVVGKRLSEPSFRNLRKKLFNTSFVEPWALGAV
jgi:hypothetical protein